MPSLFVYYCSKSGDFAQRRLKICAIRGERYPRHRGTSEKIQDGKKAD